VRLQRYYPKKKKNSGKKEKNTQSIKCHKCSGFGHVRAKCPNYGKSKGKDMNATLIDESNFVTLMSPLIKMEITWLLLLL
jgi:hypothetical protein